MSLLLIIEHNNQTCHHSTGALLHAVKQYQAHHESGPVIALIAGHECDSVANTVAGMSGIDKVIVADNVCYAHLLPEVISLLAINTAKEQGAQAIIMAATSVGKNILPRVAALLDMPAVADVIQIQDKYIYQRPIYAGNALQTVHNSATIQCLTIRPTAFQGSSIAVKETPATVIPHDHTIDNSLSMFMSLSESATTERPSLSSARVVVSGGRGLQSKEQFTMLESLAKPLNAAIGASRAAVDAGFVPNEYQVGQTGQVVAPELYIAIGISGAIQHLAGMKDSRIIVAINKDPDAPIFQIADYGLVGDLFEIVPKLTALLSEGQSCKKN